MKVICIDGQSKHETTVSIPEGVPIDVFDTILDADYYLVSGFEVDPETGNILIWHKRRFVPLSETDEVEIQAEHEHEAIIYQR